MWSHGWVVHRLTKVTRILWNVGLEWGLFFLSLFGQICDILDILKASNCRDLSWTWKFYVQLYVRLAAQIFGSRRAKLKLDQLEQLDITPNTSDIDTTNVIPTPGRSNGSNGSNGRLSPQRARTGKGADPTIAAEIFGRSNLAVNTTTSREGTKVKSEVNMNGGRDVWYEAGGKWW